ncbi:hypothetical protein Dsin_009855 [Dipteronia sinensis]|uniref:RPW8 domain-containing protein n=1 Tax=Dipteronia sinensis TaxID=43782 RepID=A0AAE0AS41_9ROSI|nr:hypothetical protein Dsin_009855 [Dipteronia sinensis]
MAAANVGGAFLGAVFGEVLNVVKDATGKAYQFKSELEELKSTLESITPTVEEIDKLNELLDIPGPETAKLKEELIKGAKLVRKSSKVKRFSFFNRVNYADKIIKLKKSIETFCNVILQTQMARDNKRIMVGVNTMVKKLSVNENSVGVFNRVEIDGPCSVPDFPASTPGLDVPMKELRTELLKDDKMRVIVVSAPGGAGKTTLIKKLCKDDQVKEKKKMDLVVGALLGTVFGELLKLVSEAKNKSDEYETELAKLKSTLESITPVVQEIETLNIALNIPEQETAMLKEELIKGMELVRKFSEVKCCCFKRVNYADKLVKLNQSIERICRVDMLTQLIRDNKKILEKVEEIGFNIQTELITDNKKILEKVEEIGFNIQAELITDNKKILEQVEEIGVNVQTQLITDNKKILEQVEEMGVNIQTELIRDNKKILEQVEEIRKIIDRDGGVSNRVEFDGPCMVPDPPEITPGLDSSLKELRTELVKDEGMQVIVVSAPGGAGKTTLVKKLCADDQVKGRPRLGLPFLNKPRPAQPVFVSGFFRPGTAMPGRAVQLATSRKNTSQKLSRTHPTILDKFFS